jgi:hypothetical protein
MTRTVSPGQAISAAFEIVLNGFCSDPIYASLPLSDTNQVLAWEAQDTSQSMNKANKHLQKRELIFSIIYYLFNRNTISG